MNKIRVIGLGPGHRDYILPIAMKMLNTSDRVYGGKRHLEVVNDSVVKVPLKVPLIETIEDIKKHYQNEQVSVLVSGDTGFYSFLETIKKHFNDEDIETYPGISSLQYLFSKLNKSYHHAYIGSVHGRDLDLSIIRDYELTGLLTDKKVTPDRLMKYLKEHAIEATMYVGENLSYEDECITKLHTSSYVEMAFGQLCVVVIERD